MRKLSRIENKLDKQERAREAALSYGAPRALMPRRRVYDDSAGPPKQEYR
jgi:hypothetical protein